MSEDNCPVCGYYCIGKGGVGCIDKPGMTENKLKAAISVLCDVHTESDHQTGFTVRMGATPYDYPWVDPARYVDAWETLRGAIGYPTSPVEKDDG